MTYIVIVLSIIVIILLAYTVFMRAQLYHINQLLKKRLDKHTNQVVSIELLDSQLNQLTENINKCLKAEESLRLRVLHEEEDFKKLIANISHDLRTPLTAIKGYLQLLQKSELTKEQADKLKVVVNHAEELGALIEHFFEYSYLLDVKPGVTMESINLTNLVTDCMVAYVPMLEENHLELKLDERPVIITADKEMTTRIIQNLIRNCIAHAKEKIIVEYVQNDGIEMKFQNLIDETANLDVKQIFDRFYVANHARKSTGLGLSIVKLLIEQMNGKVSASLEERLLTIHVYFHEGEIKEIKRVEKEE